jgi:hypothetical protein
MKQKRVHKRSKHQNEKSFKKREKRMKSKMVIKEARIENKNASKKRKMKEGKKRLTK